MASPGGPWAVDARTPMEDAATGATPENVGGTSKSIEPLAASTSVKEIALEGVGEWIAQCIHSSMGWPKALPWELCSVDLLSIETVCM